MCVVPASVFCLCHILAWLRAFACAGVQALRAHFTGVSRVVAFGRGRRGDFNNSDELNEGQRQCHRASIVIFDEVIDLQEIQACGITKVICPGLGT